MKVFITSGGTKVRIDSVRHLANMSKGTFGANIATEAMNRGHDVSYMICKDGRTPFSMEVDVHHESCDGKDVASVQKLQDLIKFYENHKQQYNEINYDDFASYHYLLRNNLMAQKPDVIILSAAVSDYGVDFVDGKIQSSDGMDLKFIPLPKIIKHVKKWCPNSLLVGFKLLDRRPKEELIEAANNSIKTNHCDLVVANDISTLRAGKHEILIIDRFGNIERHTTNLAKAVMDAVVRPSLWVETLKRKES